MSGNTQARGSAGSHQPVDAKLFGSLSNGAPARAWRTRMQKAGLHGNPGEGVLNQGSPAYRVMVLQAALGALELAERRRDETLAEVPIQMEYPRPGFWAGVLLFGLIASRFTAWPTALALTVSAGALGLAAIVTQNARSELARRQATRSEANLSLDKAQAAMSKAAELLVATVQANPGALDLRGNEPPTNIAEPVSQLTEPVSGLAPFDDDEGTMEPWEIAVSSDRTVLEAARKPAGVLPAEMAGEHGFEVALPD